MYSNNIVNFQEFPTILNAYIKKSGNLWYAPRIYIYIYIYIYEMLNGIDTESTMLGDGLFLTCAIIEEGIAEILTSTKRLRSYVYAISS